MKILIISDAWHPQVNGVVRTYEYLSQELVKAGHVVEIVGPASFKRTIPMPGYAEIKLAIAPKGQLKHIIETAKADYIHIATEGPLGWAARNYCIKHNYEFTTTYHTHFPDYAAKRFSKYLPFLFKPIHAICRHIVKTFHAGAESMFVATKSLEKELKEWGFKTPMQPLSRGANLDIFHHGTQTLFKDLPKPIALYVGRIAIEKNIESFLAMPWSGSKIIVGKGPSRAALEKQYPEAHFVGTKTGQELGDHYRSADIFIFPSRTDTFGMVLVEAMACGLPVAAYNVTGPKDIITEDMLGALTEDDLSTAAQKALSHSATKQQRADYTKQHYSWKAASEQFLNGIKKQG